jgi:hypothetical protein
MTRPVQSSWSGIAAANAVTGALAVTLVLLAGTVAAQTIQPRPDGLLEVTDAPPGTVVRYTLDGTDPTRDAGVWLAPVDLPATRSRRVRSRRTSRRSGHRSKGYEAWAAGDGNDADTPAFPVSTTRTISHPTAPGP